MEKHDASAVVAKWNHAAFDPFPDGFFQDREKTPAQRLTRQRRRRLGVEAALWQARVSFAGRQRAP